MVKARWQAMRALLKALMLCRYSNFQISARQMPACARAKPLSFCKAWAKRSMALSCDAAALASRSRCKPCR